MGSDNGPSNGRRGSLANAMLAVAVICGAAAGGIVFYKGMDVLFPNNTAAVASSQQHGTAGTTDDLTSAQEFIMNSLTALSEQLERVSREGVNLTSSQEYVEDSWEAVQDLASNLAHEVDHAYHQITNTNDDDGRFRDFDSLPESAAAAMLQGEELLPSEQVESPRDKVSEHRKHATVVVESPPSQGLLGLAARHEEEEGRDGERQQEEKEEVEPLEDILAAHSSLQYSAPLKAPLAPPIAMLPGRGSGPKQVFSLSSSLHQATLPGVGGLPTSAFVSKVPPVGATASTGLTEVGVERRELSIVSQGGQGSGIISANLGASRGFADMWIAQKKEKVKEHLSCGNMPAAFWPKFTNQREPKATTKVYNAKDGTVMPMGLDGKQVKVRTEHGKRARRSATNKRRLKNGEQSLVDCLNNLVRCTSSSMRAALALRGMREALTSKHKLLSQKYKSCAVVGNSGGMMHHKYGRYIDTHDFVMRINILPTKSRRENLGEKVSGRVLSYKMSKDVCCIQKDYQADNPDLQYFIWFPASRPLVKERMKKKLKTNPVHIMSPGFVNSAVLAFKTFRGEMLRLGYGPFEDWEYMTSGMHAVLGMIRSCEIVNVYGFTTDVNTKGPYWFTGRAVAPRSGQTQHAWDHERMTLRLLHAAGAINICTT